MSAFACAISLAGDPVAASFRASIESWSRASNSELCWRTTCGFVGAAASGGGVRPTFVQVGGIIAVGTVRLDNRDDVAGSLAIDAGTLSDLELAARFVMRDGGVRARLLLGDFAFVAWDPDTRTVLAARDTFGVRKLFHTDLTSGTICFASHASLLASESRFDDRYLVERICQCGSDPRCTVYSDVSAVAPAGLLRIRNGRCSLSSFWSPTDVARGPAMAEREQCEAFRELLVASVRLRLGDGGNIWSHLSGGLDSSSVVSIAEWLAARREVPARLAGTVTYTDALGTSADEREFSDAVVDRYGLRNELVSHRSSAPESASDLPSLDQPNFPLVMAIRDRAAARLVHGAGGRVLLTGEGGDSLVAGTMFFFADWLVSGRARQALREMAHRSALGRVSFWRLAYENAALPLLPRQMRRALTRRRPTSTPPWIPVRTARRYELAARSAHEQLWAGRIGHKYEDALACTVGAIPSGMPLGPQDDVLDVRHPYLYRPLVEFALQLPPGLCVRPHARKWILREAMRGVLPEKVRTRVGKGALDGLNAWSLAHEQQRVDHLLREPMLAELGCVDRTALQRVLDDVRAGNSRALVWRDLLSTTLEVEMWLQLRSGRWAATNTQRTMQQKAAIHSPTTAGHLSRSIT